MRAVVVYESMYGNTHLIADAIGEGLRSCGDATVVPVDQATPELVTRADLLVVGGPTHAHAMSRETTRRNAIDEAHQPGSDLHLDPDAEGEGLREWFDSLDSIPCAAAAFDTRIDLAPVLTGRASKGIKKRLTRHGARLVAEPESFFVEKDNTLHAGEAARAEAWGRTLAGAVGSVGSGVSGRGDSGAVRS